MSFSSFTDHELEIKSALRMYTSKYQDSKSLFNALLDRMRMSTEKPCHNMISFSTRSTKAKGDIFEVFCLMYLRALGYDAYLQKDLPNDLRISLRLPTSDMGIDIIACQTTENNEKQWIAVQCKYRKKNQKRRTIVGWGDLSTFYTLCERSGPWYQRLVMTNCDGIRRQGISNGTHNDLSWTGSYFERTPRELWMKILGSTGRSLLNNDSALALPVDSTSLIPLTSSTSPIQSNSLSMNEMRQKRLEFFTGNHA